MPEPDPGPVRVPCVGVVVLDDAGRLLLIKRGHPPSAGRWSIPGGRVEEGETLEQAAVREAREETGLDVVVGAVAGRVELPGVGEEVYDVTDFLATQADPRAVATPGDDADDARWVTRAQLDDLETSPGLVATLDSWQNWP
jgi:ADP-ribose pyrophosphatase YjhB (NUDIX family)